MDVEFSVAFAISFDFGKRWGAHQSSCWACFIRMDFCT
jgi:hypothetical protein